VQSCSVSVCVARKAVREGRCHFFREHSHLVCVRLGGPRCALLLQGMLPGDLHIICWQAATNTGNALNVTRWYIVESLESKDPNTDTVVQFTPRTTVAIEGDEIIALGESGLPHVFKISICSVFNCVCCWLFHPSISSQTIKVLEPLPEEPNLPIFSPPYTPEPCNSAVRSRRSQDAL